jgi:hypothetical protein
MLPTNYLSDIYPILNKMSNGDLFNINRDSITSDVLPNIVGYQTLFNKIVDNQLSKALKTDIYIIKTIINNCVVYYCGQKYLTNIESEIFAGI